MKDRESKPSMALCEYSLFGDQAGVSLLSLLFCLLSPRDREVSLSHVIATLFTPFIIISVKRESRATWSRCDSPSRNAPIRRVSFRLTPFLSRNCARTRSVALAVAVAAAARLDSLTHTLAHAHECDRYANQRLLV